MIMEVRFAVIHGPVSVNITGAHSYLYLVEDPTGNPPPADEVAAIVNAHKDEWERGPQPARARVTWQEFENPHLQGWYADCPRGLHAAVYPVSGVAFGGVTPHGFYLDLKDDHLHVRLAEGRHSGWSADDAKRAAEVAVTLAIQCMEQ